MTGIVDWASGRARMVLAFIVLSLAVGWFSYTELPKEGEPDIEIPALFVSVPFDGISAEDSEKLLVRTMETELADLDGLKSMEGTAAEGYAGVALEFEFGWDKTKIMADVREAMNTAEANFPTGADKYSINEINLSEFPIIIVSLTGDVPERTLIRLAKSMQDRLEAQEPVLEAVLAGYRDEMVEVIIDPVKLEAYNVTAPELVSAVVNNNRLIAAGEVETASGAFAVKIPSSFDESQDIFNLPIKTNGDRIVTLADLTDIRLTFEDRYGTARFNGETTVAVQVVKRKGFNLIDTAAMVREEVLAEKATWPEELQTAVSVTTSNDQSYTVQSMVSQLEGSVLTAIALVMIVVLAALGGRPALLVGFAIPTSFLLCFAFLALMGVTISNIVMFGLILAVGMLVDGAIVVVEYAEKRMEEGQGPMRAYVEGAKRMFWPIVSSTATTLCAFLPMLFWPGIPGEFMGMLPVTLIFVLSASLVVALVYLPVMGGVAGRMGGVFDRVSLNLRGLPWVLRLGLLVGFAALAFLGLQSLAAGTMPVFLAVLAFFFGVTGITVAAGSLKPEKREKGPSAGYRRSLFGHFIALIAANPVMPIVTIVAVIGFVGFTFFQFRENSNGIEFFVETEPEQAQAFVRARGNLSLDDQDRIVAEVEQVIMDTEGVSSVFAFAGEGGLNTDACGVAPSDTIGQIQFETTPWSSRPTQPFDGEWWQSLFLREVVDPFYDGNAVLDRIREKVDQLPGIYVEVSELAQGPAQGKPVHLRIMGDDWEDLQAAAKMALDKFAETPGLIDLEDTLPLPGIDWEINVDVEQAGRFGADVATVGAMVQLVTRGVYLDDMRVDTSDEEIEIRARLPEENRLLSTLDTLKVSTASGLVPLSYFIDVKPVAKLGQIDRIDQKRYFDVKADVASDLTLIQMTPAAPTDGDPSGTVEPVSVGFGELVSPEDVDAGADVTFSVEYPGSDLFAFLIGPKVEHYLIDSVLDGEPIATAQSLVAAGASFSAVSVNPNERIAVLNEWLATNPLPLGISTVWTGDQEEQEESQEFLARAMVASLGLMAIILLAQFNSFYNAVVVLLAVVLSTTGVLWGMMLLDQTFSIIMTGTGIVALAGIVVNNNIVLIDTYQEYSRYMPRTEAIVRTAEARIRPVLLTTLTTMAGLTPMMLGLSLDFANGGATIDSPTALWWKQLATAVVFGLGTATALTLVFTPAMLALRVWLVRYLLASVRFVARYTGGRRSRAAEDWILRRRARREKNPEILWDIDGLDTDTPPQPAPTLRAAE